MKFVKYTSLSIFMLALGILFSSWGYVGHNKINTNASLSFNQDMSQFLEWTSILAAHASDADIRKSWDPTEGPKHYLDIDNYPGFLTSGVIPQILDSAIAQYGYDFVYDQGILPWATETTFDSLQSCFERGDWEKAILFAADLGHYVADGHMPMHITRNYNGQYSGNYGIHSRYESEMIGMYNSQIIYQGYQVSAIEDINQYIFNYLYTSYPYVDSILAADNYAQDVAGNDYSNLYYETLWEQTENMTVLMFKEASHTLAELIYSAWVNAGSPLIATVYSPSINKAELQIQNFPNPFTEQTKITFSLSSDASIILEILDVSGNRVTTLLDDHKPTGAYQVDWDAQNFRAGVYYAVLRSDNNAITRKMILMR